MSDKHFAFSLGRVVAALEFHLSKVGESIGTLKADAAVNPHKIGAYLGKGSEYPEVFNALLPVVRDLPVSNALIRPLTEQESVFYWSGYASERGYLHGVPVPPPPKEPNDAAMTIRLPASLKEWVDKHGGADLIRLLLHRERERRQDATP